MLHSGMYSKYLSLFSLNCLRCRVESSVHLGSKSDLRVKIADGRVKVEREREQMRAAEKQNRAAQEQIREIFSQIEQINQEIEEIQAATKHSLGGNQKKKLESVSKLKPSGGEIKNKVFHVE